MAKARKAAQTEGEADAEGPETPWTMSIPDAGRKYYGLGKAASYQASGPVGEDVLIPYIEAGRLKRALPRLIEKKLAGGSND